MNTALRDGLGGGILDENRRGHTVLSGIGPDGTVRWDLSGAVYRYTDVLDLEEVAPGVLQVVEQVSGPGGSGVLGHRVRLS